MAFKFGTRRQKRWLVAACIAGSGLILAGDLAIMIRRAGRRIEHANCMHNVLLSLQSFNEAYDRLPPPVCKDKKGRPLFSWRFQIMPFLAAWMERMELDESWQSPGNDRWVKHRNYWYCWTDPGSPDELETNVVAITGPGTAFDEDHPTRLKDIPPSTILCVEIAHSGIHWMAPGDLQLGKLPPSLARGLDGRGFHVGCADGTVWFVTADVPLSEIEKLCTIEGAKKYDREKVLGFKH